MQGKRTRKAHVYTEWSWRGKAWFRSPRLAPLLYANSVSEALAKPPLFLRLDLLACIVGRPHPYNCSVLVPWLL